MSATRAKIGAAMNRPTPRNADRTLMDRKDARISRSFTISDYAIEELDKLADSMGASRSKVVEYLCRYVAPKIAHIVEEELALAKGAPIQAQLDL